MTHSDEHFELHVFFSDLNDYVNIRRGKEYYESGVPAFHNFVFSRQNIAV